MEDIKLKALIAVLVDWINDELAEHRMIVQNVDEDLYDGQVLQKLLGNITVYYTFICFFSPSFKFIYMEFYNMIIFPFSLRKTYWSEVRCS